MTLIAVLSILTFTSHSCESKTDLGPPHYIQDNTIEIYVSGAVEKPGAYRVPKGTTIQEILNQAKPLPEADLKRLKIDSKLKRGRHLKIGQGPKRRKGPKGRKSTPSVSVEPI